MATQIQRRRGTTAQHSTFTGALGELTVDTDKKTVVVHDGITAGGSPLAVASTLASTYAPLASPALSGTPTAPTAAAGTNTTQLATTAFVTTAIDSPALTGSAKLNGATNNTVQLTDIVTALGLEEGDVIRIQYSGYNKLHTVESITNNDLIVVNYEHAGNRGNGSLKLADKTAAVTITRIAKWHNAPLGLGQAWVDLRAFRQDYTNYTNSTGRSIAVTVMREGLSALTRVGILVNGIVLAQNYPATVRYDGDRLNANSVYADVPVGAVYSSGATSAFGVFSLMELR